MRKSDWVLIAIASIIAIAIKTGCTPTPQGEAFMQAMAVQAVAEEMRGEQDRRTAEVYNQGARDAARIRSQGSGGSSSSSRYYDGPTSESSRYYDGPTSGGDHYEGGICNGKWDGHGTYTWQSGQKYVGEFKDGTISGHGTYTWPSGRKYVGQFKDGLSHGQGTLTSPDGRKYVGEWREDQRHGHGKLTLPDGSECVGEWREDQLHGYGTHRRPDGSEYVGEWQNGLPNGEGTETTSDEVKYVGTFKNGQRHGRGVITRAGWVSPGGVHYRNMRAEIEHREGKPHGLVTSSAIMEGFPVEHSVHWEAGEQHGEANWSYCGWTGVEHWEHGVKVSGAETAPNGTTYEISDCEELEDEWIKETKAGSNGRTYTGIWNPLGDRGNGTLEYPDGRVYEGEWANPNFAIDVWEPDGSGIMTWPDGTRYIGKWRLGERHGNGTQTTSDDIVQSGEWHNDEFVGE